MGLAPGVTTTLSGSVLVPRTSRLLLAMAWRSSGSPAVGAVVGEPVADGRHAGIYDVPGRVEVGFPNFHVNYLASQGFQSASLGQHLEGALSPQVVHSRGDGHCSSKELQLAVCRLRFGFRQFGGELRLRQG